MLSNALATGILVSCMASALTIGVLTVVVLAIELWSED